MSFHSVIIQKLLSTNAHIGRHVTSHHFKIFSVGTRNSVSVIDSDKTLISLRSACSFISHLSRLPDSRFLFVNTNPLFDDVISHMTQTLSLKNDSTWRLGGFLTNSSSPKKFKGRNKKLNLSSVRPPDCIVIFDTERKSSVVNEAYRLQIPVVGLVDSSVPLDVYRKITYPVPGNDSVEFVYLFCNLITKSILKERKAMAAVVAVGEEKAIQGEDALLSGQTGKKLVFPYEDLQAISEDSTEIKKLLDKLVVVKFNGSLGTKIGFNAPKCLVEVGDGWTCLDVIVNQIEALNSKYGCNIPLLMVNAINTHDHVLKALEKHPNKNIHSVIQNKLRQETAGDFVPLSDEGQDDQDEMNSVNLAEVFLPLRNGGKLDVLLSQGKEYILMLSSDNLAHVVDPKILNHMVQNNIEYCLEVMPKTSEVEGSDISPTEENKTSMPKKNWKFIDTMWMNINSIGSLLSKITARPNISQLFDKHFALSVPKSRYLSVEATSDLFLLQSDLYTLTDGILTRNTARENPADPSIELGPEFENVTEFRRRFKSIPSVVGLDSLKVSGDVYFGTGITLKGKVVIQAGPLVKIVIPDGAVLENRMITSQRDLEGALR